MTPYKLTAKDYEFIHDVLSEAYVKNKDASEQVTRKLMLLLRPERLDFTEFHEKVINKQFETMPSKELSKLEDFINWPESGHYKVQKKFYPYFKEKGVDLGEVFREVSCSSVSIEALGLRFHAAPVYATGLKEGVFINEDKEQLLNLALYLNKKFAKGYKSPQAENLLFLFEKVVSLNSKKIYAPIEKFLHKDINSENILFKKLITTLSTSCVPSEYVKINNAILFSNDFMVEKNEVGLSIRYDLKKMVDKFQVDAKIINLFMSEINDFYKGSSLLNSIRTTWLNETININTLFNNEEDRNKWKKDYDKVFEFAKINNFELNDSLKSIIEKLRLSDSLLESLKEKEPGRSMKI